MKWSLNRLNFCCHDLFCSTKVLTLTKFVNKSNKSEESCANTGSELQKYSFSFRVSRSSSSESELSRTQSSWRILRFLFVDTSLTFSLSPLPLQAATFICPGAKMPSSGSVFLRNPRGLDRQVIIDVAVTWVDGQSRTSDEASERPTRSLWSENS